MKCCDMLLVGLKELATTTATATTTTATPTTGTTTAAVTATTTTTTTTAAILPRLQVQHKLLLAATVITIAVKQP